MKSVHRASSSKSAVVDVTSKSFRFTEDSTRYWCLCCGCIDVLYAEVCLSNTFAANRLAGKLTIHWNLHCKLSSSSVISLVARCSLNCGKFAYMRTLAVGKLAPSVGCRCFIVYYLFPQMLQFLIRIYFLSVFLGATRKQNSLHARERKQNWFGQGIDSYYECFLFFLC